MTAIEQVLRDHPLPRWRAAVWVLILLFAAVIVWAATAKLDEVAIAGGEVVPQGKVKVIQHYEGGMIAELYVQEGAAVAAGQPLLQLDVSASGANREDLLVRLDSLLIARARLKAEADDTAFTLPPDLATRRPDLMDAERQNFLARMKQQQSAIEVLKAQIRQRDLEVRQLRDRQRTLTGDHRLSRERLRMSSDLVEKNLTPKLEHLTVQREFEMLEGELSSIAIQIPRAQAALDEAQLRLREQETRFRREAAEELNKNEPQISRTREMLTVSNDQFRRTKILSPIDGIVKDLRFNTIGGVVRPGDPIMQVVPTEDSLVIESKLSPADRGYVKVGQSALVKVTAYDFYRYGALRGTVTNISADSTTLQDGTAVFKVMVETERTFLGDPATPLPITSGMQASVEVHTGERSVLEFLLKPVLRIRYEGFRER